MFYTLRNDLRAVWACTKKDLQSALTERLFTIVSVFVPLNVLILTSLFVLSGGRAPTAVVMLDNGPYAHQFYNAMSHAHSFSLRITSASQAQNLIDAGRIVAVVTIPADFDQRIRADQPVQMNVEINNLNTDFTNDIRRAVPLSITTFYAKAFPHLVNVTPNETDFYPQDTDYIPYLSVSILVVAMLLGGLLQSGIGTAREWERETIKELLLSPASRWALLVGKALSAYILSLVAVAVVLATVVLVIGQRPVHWGEVIGFTLLILLIFVALGALLGALIKQRQAVTALSIGLTLPLFFLSGAFGPISFNTPAIQILAQIFPVYYAVVLQQHAFHGFDLNTLGVGMNVLILCGYALLTLILATLVLRRSTVSH